MIIIKLKYKNNTSQFRKVIEEAIEVKKELKKDKIDKELLLGECWGLIQATFGIMFINFTVKEIFLGYKKHFKKLQDRHKQKIIKIDEYVEG